MPDNQNSSFHDVLDKMCEPFDKNLSDDQKLVFNISIDGTSSESKIINSEKVFKQNVNSILLNPQCGTCSNVQITQCQASSDPPPLPPKMIKSNHRNVHLLSDSFSSDASSASSSDSVQCNKTYGPLRTQSKSHFVPVGSVRSIEDLRKSSTSSPTELLPNSLLLDIRNHSMKFSVNHDASSSDENEEKEISTRSDSILSNHVSDNGKIMLDFYHDDQYYEFHINEHLSSALLACHVMAHDESDGSFAGIKELGSGTSTIRSSKGTIRGVKNRVRNGIATFLQMQQTNVKVSGEMEKECWQRQSETGCWMLD